MHHKLTLISACLIAVLGANASVCAIEKHLDNFQHLVRVETWTENLPDTSGHTEARDVSAEIWTEAIQAAIDAENAVHLPGRNKPYYLDGPIVLSSGQSLTADADTEVRLKPGTNTCMVRNKHVVGFDDQPVPSDLVLDSDITIEGGVWTTLGNGPNNTHGNQRGHSSKTNFVPGTHGVILLQNVQGVTVRNITVKQSLPFAVHLANIRDFTIDGLTLDRQMRDGVHVNGPATHGVIRRVTGVSHDDTVALNAWEWKNYAPSFGGIHHIVIEDVQGAPDGQHSANSIRLLPGVKRFSNGDQLDCPIHDIVIRDVTDIREFKLYDQPNGELGRENDASVGVGVFRNVRFENLTLNYPGLIQVHANADGLTIQNAKLNFPVPAEFRLMEIGPLSITVKPRENEPASWFEIFSPDLDCIVRKLSVSGVTTSNSEAELPIDQVVRVIEMKLNPDYPKSTPRGGTGKGIWIR